LRDDYAQAYRDLYVHHWWWRARERFILDVLETEPPAAGGQKILDVGCGDGWFFDQLLRFGDVEGVELSESLVSKNGPHLSRIHVGTFDRSLNLSKRFSIILMLDVLEHMSDPVSALRFALELLQPGGKLLITVPAFNALWTNHDTINNHLTRYTKASFRDTACQAGLQIERARYFFHWLFPVKMVSRVVESMFRSEPRPPRVPPVWINNPLYLFSMLENKVCSSLPVPFGSSLLVLGAKAEAKTSREANG
jgi:2-polyprenyl-3-methyl-5-hydroxy-6-metoxy-1,4-benzoquinol methylase